VAKDPEQLAHLEWLGYVQPVGLVVSIPAMLAAQAYVNRHILPDHQRFLTALARDAKDEIVPQLPDFPAFTLNVLGWEKDDLVGLADSEPLPTSLEVALPEYHERLRPTYAVREHAPKDPDKPWLMLIQVLPTGTQLDELLEESEGYWRATPQYRFERLLRETQVPIGVLTNGAELRLVYAPRGETSGYLTFPVKAMTEVAGRPIFAALHMLLSSDRLFTLGERQRLPAILADSRKYQNVVSTELSQQVLAALYEFVRGFQAADEQRNGQLLADVLANDPNHVYAGLLTVLMRLVFVLYAEDRGLLSNDPVYANHYSVTGLFERLRSDAGRHPDTMDSRPGAWAQLLTLFRLIYDGGNHGALHIPARRGYLFDPERYPFLEGRARGAAGQKPQIPAVSDGIVFRVLSNLLILDGERLSYRTLDVEQIGSVYETMMGFDLQVAEGRSIAIKPKKAHGAPAAINLEALLATRPGDRGKWLADQTDQKLSGEAAEALKNAGTVEELLAALDKKIAREATPNVVPKSAMVLQPSDERRRSGSHYTPRSLTEPIVRTTLQPILERLRSSPSPLAGEGRGEGAVFDKCPTPDQILDLKICDPAMGSGALLVEACRQLGDELVKAWHVHGQAPALPPDEEEVLHAQRLVAQRSLYGVDKNPMAVDLAKLSLWLATLAKDHPFTFLDHALRHGDSLVGLSREQIERFHWNGGAKKKPARPLFADPIESAIRRVTDFRKEILAARDETPYELLRQQLDRAEEELSLARLAGDLVIAAFFSAAKDRQRENRLDELSIKLATYLEVRDNAAVRLELDAAIKTLRAGDRPIEPFHWEIEFPEVFLRDNGGFDAIVGNPPFAGKNTLINGNAEGFVDWLKAIHEESHGNADLVAHFFRRAFNMLRLRGCFGLIATNTIGQGDTRSTGLRWICTHNGTIFDARKRFKWPGQAAVVVSVVHVNRGALQRPFMLSGREVPIITAYLFHAGSHDDPEPLRANGGKSFIGSYVLGMGFTFDDDDRSDVANPISLMRELITKARRNADRIFPYIGGEELLNSPTHTAHRYIINFGSMSETEAREWPQLMAIIEEKVKPKRLLDNRESYRRYWWHYAEKRVDLYNTVRDMPKIIALSRVGQQGAIAFLPTGQVFAESMVLFAFEEYSRFSILQCRIHDLWARFFASSMKDDMRYTPSDCFETFPFPKDCRIGDLLDDIGKEYYDFRAELMVRKNEGLTKTYNRFHEPDERSPDILKLRDLHEAMDRAVLDAYGWSDVPTRCEFLLDYEDEEDEEPSPQPSLRGRGRKKPWRYRWPDDVRDDVLARLLALNHEQAEIERLAGLAAEEALVTATNRPAVHKPVRKRARKQPQSADALFLDGERKRFYIYMLLRAWSKPLTRHALDAGLVLMLNDDIRAALLSTSKHRKKLTSPQIVEGLDYFLQEMESLGYIQIDNVGIQQVLTILAKAPSTASAPAEDLVRIDEVKQYFGQQVKSGNIVESAEHLDVKPDFVFT